MKKFIIFIISLHLVLFFTSKAYSYEVTDVNYSNTEYSQLAVTYTISMSNEQEQPRLIFGISRDSAYQVKDLVHMDLQYSDGSWNRVIMSEESYNTWQKTVGYKFQQAYSQFKVTFYLETKDGTNSLPSVDTALSLNQIQTKTTYTPVMKDTISESPSDSPKTQSSSTQTQVSAESSSEEQKSKKKESDVPVYIILGLTAVGLVIVITIIIKLAVRGIKFIWRSF